MKRIVLILMISLLLCVSLTSCNQAASIPKKCEHDPSDWVVMTAPNCTTTGVRVLSCNVCGGKTEIIPATGHIWNGATCIAAKSCKTCGVEEGGALGHANVLQRDGSDICERCNERSYTTYGVKALTGIYQLLKSPQSATIYSVYAGDVMWEGYSCVAIVTELSAQNGLGGMNRVEYVTIIDLNTEIVLAYDMVSLMMDQADYYGDLADKAYGGNAVQYLDQRIEYLKKAQKADNIIQSKTVQLEIQNVNYLNQLAKENAGFFD